jgi:hypothetical protein
MKSKKLIFLLVFFCLVFGFVVSVHGKESKPVSCYVGDPADNQYLGDVESFNVSNAASLCNSVYYDCDGKCTGCYINDDSLQVCFDATGKKYSGP